MGKKLLLALAIVAFSYNCGEGCGGGTSTEPAAENPCAAAENPCATAENPCATAENPCATAENPCATAKGH